MTDLQFCPEEMARAAALTQRFMADYHSGLAQRPVYPRVDRDALARLMAAPLPEEGCRLEDLFEELDAVILPNATHTAHPRFLPYVQPSPNAVSPFAEAVAATLNQNCNLWTLSPAANAVEQTVIRWFADLFGLGETAGGLIASGGSMANLIALTAARDRHLGAAARGAGLQGRPAPLVLYTSDQTHSSIDKAVSILGLGVDHLRRIPADDAFRLRPDLLQDAVERDRARGLEPFCVVANAGTVMTGAIDPLAALAGICRAQGLWLHVDGAYGALTALSPRHRQALAGIELADSLSLDPHKFLFTSFEAGCVLVRDAAALRHAFSSTPSYLALEEDADFVDFANYGPQLSRGFKALKVWWSLRRFGSKAFAGVIERMMELARQMGAQAEQSEDFELLAPVTLNCVCFRLVALDDRGNEAVLRRLVESGKAFLGPARIGDRFGLRACFMNLRTTPDDVAAIMAEIARLGRNVSGRAEQGQSWHSTAGH